MPLPDLPPQLLANAIFSLYRPFGASSATIAEESGTLVDTFACGRVHGGSGLSYTHILYCEAFLDIRDGCSLTSGGNQIIYTHGDEIRVYHSHGYTRFVVVWVSNVWHNGSTIENPLGTRAVYLHRHSEVII